MTKRVPCVFDDCMERIAVEDFDEDRWLPVFKSTRQHLGFFCPRHSAEVRDGRHEGRYLVSRVETGEEIIIDREPLPPKERPIDA